MQRRFARGLLVLVSGLAVWTLASAEEADFPLIEGRAALAVVNGEPITVDAFFRDLVALHGEAGRPSERRSQQKPEELLERMIDIRLILQEAGNIGLDELPDVRKAIEDYRVDAMKQLLYGLHAETVHTFDSQQVEGLYRKAVKQVRVRSLMIAERADTDELVARLERGEEFATLAAAWVEAGKAEAGNEAELLPVSQLLPVVGKVVSGMKVGDVSPPIHVGEELAVFQLLAEHFPEDPETRSELEQDALRGERTAAVQAYANSLIDKHAKRDEALLEALDFEAPEPGFDAMLEDERILAEVEGQGVVRVKDLARSIKQKFFHGVEGAIADNKVNIRKVPLLDNSLRSMAALREARLLELNVSEDYLAMVREYENGVLFQTFVKRVVEPGIRLTEKELQAYREAHLEEFSSPEMMRIEELAFDRREDAERALAALREGADFEWSRANATGQVDPDGDAERLRFPARLVVTAAFPEDVGRVVSGAAPGEYRLHAPPDGPFHVLRIREVAPPAPQPYESVKETLLQRVYGEKRKEAIQDWMGKLREASEVEVFATTEELGRMLGKMAPGEPS